MWSATPKARASLISTRPSGCELEPVARTSAASPTRAASINCRPRRSVALASSPPQALMKRASISATSRLVGTSKLYPHGRPRAARPLHLLGPPYAHQRRHLTASPPSARLRPTSLRVTVDTGSTSDHATARAAPRFGSTMRVRQLSRAAAAAPPFTSDPKVAVRAQHGPSGHLNATLRT